MTEISTRVPEGTEKVQPTQPDWGKDGQGGFSGGADFGSGTEIVQGKIQRQ